MKDVIRRSALKREKILESNRPYKQNQQLPNSMMISYFSGGVSKRTRSEEQTNRAAKLQAAIRSRLPKQIERPQAQITSAEKEADRLSKGVQGKTPEQVKQSMGRKLGANFSNVRFHLDSSSAAKADTMGAQAYTAGNNIYFGSSGFDPEIAAHQLVHTVQQGVVPASTPTVSAPI